MQDSMYVLIRSRDCFDWTVQSIRSVLRQNFHGFTILFVDDASDYTKGEQRTLKELLTGHIVVFNRMRQYSLKNAYDMISTYITDPEAVIVNVDGDDYLSRPDVLSIIADTYQQTGCWMTYGECHLLGHSWWGDLLPSRFVLKDHDLRYSKFANYRLDTPFRPLHPRTWKKWLFEKINVEDLKDKENKWFTTCEDQAIFLPMLEMSGGKYAVIQKSLYYYRFRYPDSDEVLHSDKQQQELQLIRSRPTYQPL